MAMIQSFPTGSGNGTSKISQKLGNAATNITGSTNPAEDGLYVEDLSTIVNSISLSQKTVNSDLDYCFVGFWNNTNSEVYATCTRGAAIPFNTKFEGNLEFNPTNKAIKLKAGHRYKLHYQCKQSGATDNDKHMERFYNETTSEWLKMACNCDTEDETHTMEEIYVPTVDCEVSVRNCWCPVTSFSMRVNCINTDVTGPGLKTIDCESAFIVTEIGKTVTVDPVAYLSKDGNLEETPVGSIISYMGNNVPKHYLACDGSEYNIVDYPELAKHFKDEFGAYNYFGGDGITTFAVPKLSEPSKLTKISPIMTSDTTPSPYVVTRSSVWSAPSDHAWRIFDGVKTGSEDYTWISAANELHPWTCVDLGTKTKITSFKLWLDTGKNKFPEDFTLQGSNDGTNFTNIKSFTNVSSMAQSSDGEIEFNLDRIAEYRYYKIYVDTLQITGGSVYVRIYEWEMFYQDPSHRNYIKYETTHKVFFGDQTTYKVSVPFTRAAGAGTISLTLDNTSAEDDVSMINGNTLVAPMDGYYAISYYSNQFIGNPGALDFRIKVDNNLISSDTSVKNSSTGLSVVNSIIVKLKKSQVLTFTLYASNSIPSFNGTITMALVNTLNENKVLELMNKPSKWVVGQEYDFGDGIYGVKLTLTNNSSTDSIIDLSKYNVSEIEKIEGKAVVDNGNTQALIPCCYTASAFLSCWLEIPRKLLHLSRGTQYSQSTDSFEINIWYKK